MSNQTPDMTVIDKSSWGQGPWQEEPDRKEWKDAATGLVCLAIRQESNGHWCGYVGVPRGHPAYGRQYDDVDVSVHGGLTYANTCSGPVCHIPAPGEPDNVYWLGFDCAHCDDMGPARKERGYRRYGTYRTLEYVEAECKGLARQLAALTISGEKT